MKYLPAHLWTVVILIFSAVSILGEDPLLTTKQVILLNTNSAEIVPSDEEGVVRVMVEGLKAERDYGILLSPEGTTNWVEVTKNSVWPPYVVEEFREGDYLLIGQPGDIFDLRIDRYPERPIYDRVKIEGPTPAPDPGPDPGPNPDPSPNPDFKEVYELSKAKASALNDPTTAAALSNGIKEALASLNPETVTFNFASRTLVDKIEQVLSSRKGESLDRDWYQGWRKPMADKLDEVTGREVKAYLSAMSESARGLAESVTSSASITKYKTVQVRRCLPNGTCYYENVFVPMP